MRLFRAGTAVMTRKGPMALDGVPDRFLTRTSARRCFCPEAVPYLGASLTNCSARLSRLGRGWGRGAEGGPPPAQGQSWVVATCSELAPCGKRSPL